MTAYPLAEINIARMKGVNILDPIMQEFVDNLDHINTLAESSEAFIWRLNPDYGLGFRHESKRYNKDGLSKYFLTHERMISRSRARQCSK